MKPSAFVVVPSAADRFPSYDVDVTAVKAMQVRCVFGDIYMYLKKYIYIIYVIYIYT